MPTIAVACANHTQPNRHRHQPQRPDTWLGPSDFGSASRIGPLYLDAVLFHRVLHSAGPRRPTRASLLVVADTSPKRAYVPSPASLFIATLPFIRRSAIPSSSRHSSTFHIHRVVGASHVVSRPRSSVCVHHRVDSCESQASWPVSQSYVIGITVQPKYLNMERSSSHYYRYGLESPAIAASSRFAAESQPAAHLAWILVIASSLIAANSNRVVARQSSSCILTVIGISARARSSHRVHTPSSSAPAHRPATVLSYISQACPARSPSAAGSLVAGVACPSTNFALVRARGMPLGATSRCDREPERPARPPSAAGFPHAAHYSTACEFVGTTRVHAESLVDAGLLPDPFYEACRRC